MSDDILTGEEQGGEEMGYRVPMALREEAGPDADKEPGSEEAPAVEGGDAEPAERVEVSEENILDLSESDIDAVIAQEGIEIEDGLSQDEKLLKVAEFLGYEIVEEEVPGAEEGPEGGEEGMEELKSQVLELNRRLALLSPAEELMENLEADPQGTLAQLAQYYGVQAPQPTAAPAAPGGELKVEIPNIEPGHDERMPAYIARLMQEGFKQLIPHLQASAAPPAAPTQRREDPHVKAAIGYLTQYHPDWPKFQEKMTALLKVDPSLIKDPEKLYKRAGGKGGAAARARARTKKIVKKKSSSGERGGRAPLKLASKKRLDPGKAGDMAEAWDRAKRQASGVK